MLKQVYENHIIKTLKDKEFKKLTGQSIDILALCSLPTVRHMD